MLSAGTWRGAARYNHHPPEEATEAVSGQHCGSRALEDGGLLFVERGREHIMGVYPDGIVCLLLQEWHP